VSLQGAFTSTAPQDATTVPQTLSQVVGRAGIDVANADLSGLVLTRDGRNYVLDLDMLNRHGAAQDIYLKPGDRVFLPFNDRKQIYVVGEVRDPQALTFKTSDMSLTQALGRAGGLNPKPRRARPCT
jgi:polysaccharide export outer membrane protein